MNKAQIIESKEFAYRLAEMIRDQVPNEEFAMLYYYLNNNDIAEAGRFIGEIVKPMGDWIVGELQNGP